MELMEWLIRAAGVFTLALGVVHVFLPGFLDYRGAMLKPPGTPRQFRLPLVGYEVTLQDRYGMVWVMNHAASYALISIGAVDLLGARWLLSDRGWPLALWIGGWWLVRMGSQFYLGRRRGDLLIALWFGLLGVLHISVVLIR